MIVPLENVRNKVVYQIGHDLLKKYVFLKENIFVAATKICENTLFLTLPFFKINVNFATEN